MAQTAAPLVDHVITHVPVRQWVLSLPIPLRLLLAAQPKLVTPMLQVVPQVVPQESEASAHEARPAEGEAGCAHHRPVRLSWAKLLKRVFDLDLEHCPNCGGELRIIAAILWSEPGRRRS